MDEEQISQLANVSLWTQAGTMAALFLVMIASLWLGAAAQRAVENGPFLKSFFLGNRSLGSWALALTATVQSGGTFMGFPSMVYTHGWSAATWIAGYMVVPITGLAVLGKRLAQLSRRTGALTVPDLFRRRYDSPAVGLVSSLLIMYFLMFATVAQFKAGAIVMEMAWPHSLMAATPITEGGPTNAYLLGLALFAIVVVGYTLMGGFLATVWTDLFQSVLMLIGVVILLALTLPMVGGVEQASRRAADQTSAAYVMLPGYEAPAKPAKPAEATAEAASETGSEPAPATHEFLPPTLMFSMFFVWVFGGIGSPAGTVRVMACKDAPTLRRSVIILSLYNLLIYIPLILICIAARSILPDLDTPDAVIPRMAEHATQNIPGGSLITGLILSAPFGAVMASVSCYILVIASGLVHDVYHRFIRPEADEQEIKTVTRWVMIAIGVLAVATNIQPIKYLQVLVVFTASSAAATFVVPSFMASFSRRSTAAGALAAMAAGCGITSLLWALGLLGLDPGTIGPKSSFRPLYFLGLEPILWGLAASLVAGIAVSAYTQPPDEQLLSKLFDAPVSPDANAEPGTEPVIATGTSAS